MRAGISRVVVEIIILVIAVALALLIFSPISGYIFGSLGRTATVGGATQIQVLNAQITTSDSTTYYQIDVKNLGPGAPSFSSDPKSDFIVYVDGTTKLTVSDITDASGSSLVNSLKGKPWDAGVTITLKCDASNAPDSVKDKTRQHNIIVYGPGNTQVQYLYYPPPS